MSIRTMASSKSAWRGYTYYKENKVLSFTQTGQDEYTGQVAGSGAVPYQVKINTAHARQCKCNCPFADGRRAICKHMVALFFTAFPEEAEQYYKEIEELRREEERRKREQKRIRDKYFEDLRSYVESLSKEELQKELFYALIALGEEYNGY